MQQVIHSADMKMYSWNYTQFSQFNETDSLLLVSGVHFGAHTASGEIAVFNVEDGFQLQCRVLNKPYDIFGTWYTDEYLISGRLHFLGHLVSCSALWLNKAWQETESERKPIIKRMYKFYNKNASSIRMILMANCLTEDEPNQASGLTNGDAVEEEKVGGSKRKAKSDNANSLSHHLRGNPVSGQWSSTTNQRLKALQTPPSFPNYIDYFGARENVACTNESPIRYSADYRNVQNTTTNSNVRRAPSTEVVDDTDSGINYFFLFLSDLLSELFLLVSFGWVWRSECCWFKFQIFAFSFAEANDLLTLLMALLTWLKRLPVTRNYFWNNIGVNELEIIDR